METSASCVITSSGRTVEDILSTKVDNTDARLSDARTPLPHTHSAAEVSGALTVETDPTVPAWAKAPEKPVYNYAEVGADAAGTANAVIAAHVATPNPHNITPAGIGADPAGAAGGVQYNLDLHVGNYANPHAVSVEQTGGIRVYAMGGGR